jgi:hypothetical protein
MALSGRLRGMPPPKIDAVRAVASMLLRALSQPRYGWWATRTSSPEGVRIRRLAT